MTRWAWTGSRGPLTPAQIALVTLDVSTVVHDGDEVGQGGCKGVDEVVLATALLMKLRTQLRVVTFPADGERTWEQTRAPIDLILCSDEVRWREKGWKYLERDRALVEWAEFVRAMPLIDFTYDAYDQIVPERGSGTNYTARIADEVSKLAVVRPLNVMALIAEIKSKAGESVHGSN